MRVRGERTRGRDAAVVHETPAGARQRSQGFGEADLTASCCSGLQAARVPGPVVLWGPGLTGSASASATLD